MASTSRVLAVTAGLVAVGGVAGAIAGAVVAAVLTLSVDGPPTALDLALLGFGAGIGASLGAVLLPIAGWSLMRRVPLGRALLGTAAGTIAGGLVGWFVPIGSNPVTRTLIAGVLGFALAVVMLRRSARTTASAGKSPVA